MFEIRIICDPADTDRVSHALAAAFDTGQTRHYPTHDGKRTRLYVTADHRPAPEPPAAAHWPAPEEAYALAPSIISEIGWTARTATDRLPSRWADREFWLRKAALLDRIVLSNEAVSGTSDAASLATRAAQRLMELDDDTAVICDPRHYVRQQYAHWAKNQ